MALTNVLKLFRQSRIAQKKLELQQRRNIFKYYKSEPQENLDGHAKARQVFRKVARQALLAPKYRLRPFSERYHPTEMLDFLKKPGPWRVMAMGYFFGHAFYELFKDRREMEEALVNHYHPETDTEMRWGTAKDRNLLNRHLCWDQQQGIPYRDG